ncbi:MAG TPA: redoxin family protein [Candidatus Angelobacter sp.]|nr:redoxin family protein [Candidatus Angelobacter sp.]
MIEPSICQEFNSLDTQIKDCSKADRDHLKLSLMRWGRIKTVLALLLSILSVALCNPKPRSGVEGHVHDWQQVSLVDSDGKVHTSAEWAGKRAVVLLFVTTDCPLSNGYVPEFNRLQRAYGPKGITFYAVQGDATIASEEVRRHVKEFGYSFPYLIDPQESLASYTGATTTPEAAVLSPGGELLYMGRIDNRLEDYGKHRVQVTEFDLRDALEAVVNGKAVSRPRTKPFGCAIIRTP